MCQICSTQTEEERLEEADGQKIKGQKQTINKETKNIKLGQAWILQY